LTIASSSALWKLSYVIAMLVLMVPSRALAQPAPAVGVALDRYATIHGASLLDQKCKFFAPNLRAELQAHVRLIRVSLEMAIGNPTMFAMIDNGAQKTVDSEKYASCPKDAENIVLDALFIARAWSTTIRRAAVEGAARAGSSSSPSKPSAPPGPTP
jgi:hypothetical protein